MMEKALWLSRHAMTEEQKESLEKWIGTTNLEIVTENVTWQASEDEDDDYAVNQKEWCRLIDEYQPSVIAGVFPPVALEARPDEKLKRAGIQITSPISRQTASERADGTKQIEFHHVRWSLDLNS